MIRIFALAILMVVSVSYGVAQTSKSTKVFAVKGIVVDRKGDPLGFALVYLMDIHSHTLRIKRAGSDGRFNFTVLNAQLDYEIYAERDDLTSEKTLVSGSQKAAVVIVTLKLSRNH